MRDGVRVRVVVLQPHLTLDNPARHRLDGVRVRVGVRGRLRTTRINRVGMIRVRVRMMRVKVRDEP